MQEATATVRQAAKHAAGAQDDAPNGNRSLDGGNIGVCT